MLLFAAQSNIYSADALNLTSKIIVADSLAAHIFLARATNVYYIMINALVIYKSNQ